MILADNRWRWALWIGIAMLLLALPFATEALLGRSWVRILAVALLFVMLALGLNIVVGFAGLLDLGYIAFFAVGAYSYALLASPQFGIHWPVLLLLPLGAALAALFGILLGAPTLRLRGDYLAIVTLGFGEIIRVVVQNTDAFGRALGLSGVPQHTSLFSCGFVVVLVVVVARRIHGSSHGRALLAIRED